MSPWREKVSGSLSWLVCTAYVGLFFEISFSNITLFVLLAACLLILTRKHIVDTIRSEASMQLLILFYLVHIAGLGYTQNLDQGLFVLEKKATLLIMPVILFPALQRMPPDEKSNLLFRLGIITIGSSIVFIGIGIYKTILCGDPFAFHRDYFATIPYVFYGIYFATGCLVLLNSLFERLQNKRTRNLLMLLLIIYSLGLLVLISSKTGIVAYVTGLNYFLYRRIASRRVFFVSMAGVVLSLSLLLAIYPTTLKRFTELTRNLHVVSEDTVTASHYEEFTGLNLRLFFWKTAITELWKDNRLVAGVGTGDGQDYLNEAYKKRHLDEYGYLGYDPHNQWVITLLQLGMAGVFLLGLVFMTATWKAMKLSNIYFILFAWVMFCYSLSESVLESNKGIVFFALFFCVLSTPGKNKVTGVA